jgi:hypothetical protein
MLMVKLKLKKMLKKIKFKKYNLLSLQIQGTKKMDKNEEKGKKVKRKKRMNNIRAGNKRKLNQEMKIYKKLNNNNNNNK